MGRKVSRRTTRLRAPGDEKSLCHTSRSTTAEWDGPRSSCRTTLGISHLNAELEPAGGAIQDAAGGAIQDENRWLIAAGGDRCDLDLDLCCIGRRIWKPADGRLISRA
jgi:hypothetical protein